MQIPPLAWKALLALLLATPAEAAFEPARTFPDTSDTIRVFVDQLPGPLTHPQAAFAARHYVGTQKLQSAQIDALRAYNPDLIMLQYRLGTRQSDPSVVHIHNDRWTTDWPEVSRHDDWFLYTRDEPRQRVYQLVENVREYVMDVSGKMNGDTRYGWKEYWAETVIGEARASHADGVFADSTHPPYSVPASLNNSPLGAPPYEEYLTHLEAFYDYVYRRLDEANLYFIPNVGSLVTTWDTTTGYYEDVHGIMVEGFAFRGNTADWIWQQNCTLKALRNGKIYIAQHGARADQPERRLWYISNFLLLKHDRSYINMFASGPGLDGQLHWWPEYELKLGRALAPLPETIDAWRHGSGVYFREYQGGLVLVNPNGATRTVRLAGPQKYVRVAPWGGGIVGPRGAPPRGGMNLEQVDGEVALEAWSGAILLKVRQRPPGEEPPADEPQTEPSNSPPA